MMMAVGSIKSKDSHHISIKPSENIMEEGEDLWDLEEAEMAAEQNSWMNIIFLPFQSYWMYIIVATTIISSGVNIMDFVFKVQDTHVHTFLYYCCEVLYTIHTAAQIAHKKMTVLRKMRYYHPVSYGLLFLNIISLFPYFEVYVLLNAYTWNYVHPVDSTRLKVGIRLLPVIAYLIMKKREVGVRQIFVVLQNQILIMGLIITCLSCVWYMMTDYGDVENDWSIYLKPYQFSVNNTLHWMVLCTHITGTFFVQNTIGRIFGVTALEKVFLLVITFCGFFLILMIFYGELIGVFIQSYWHHHEYTARLKKIAYLLNDWRVDKEVQKKSTEYYTVFWEMQRGMKEMPGAFEWLPISMRMDATVDIFWESFRHSHLFVNTSMAFKRSISVMMRTEFLLPGDYLFQDGKLKTKMVYIVSGVVQVLTDEDNESPILSLSSGTLLGEITCVRALVSLVNIKCATYCEFHTLDMVQLYGILRNNVEMARALTHHVETRITRARTIRAEIAHIRRVLNLTECDTSIGRVKRQWRIISSLRTAKKQEAQLIRKRLDKTFNSEYMDLIVLSRDVELKVEAICLRSTCPLVLDPHSSFRVCCQYCIILVACIQFVLIPFSIFYDKDVLEKMWIVFFILDMFCYLDIYIQLSTAVKLKDNFISHSKEIVQYRFQQFSFLLDVFSTLPYVSFIDFFKSDYKLYGTLPRVIRIYKIFTLINEKEKSLWTSNLYMRFIKYVVFSLIFVHCSTCILFVITCDEVACKEHSWFSANEHNRSMPLNNFVISYLYAMSLYLRHGISKQTGYLMLDIIVASLIILSGYFMYCFMLSELTASIVLYIKKEYAHQDEILVMQGIMKRRLVGADLYNRCINILHFNWRYNEGAEIQGANGIFNDGSEMLRTDIINDRIVLVLKQVPLFTIFSEELIRCISLNMQVTILPEETPLVEIGCNVWTVYVILRGYCLMKSDLPGDRDRNVTITLKQGDMLAPIEMLHGVYSVSSIKTMTAVEILQMPCDTFKELIKTHRMEHGLIQKALEEDIGVYNNLLQKKVCRLPQLRSVKPSEGKIDSFEYKILQKKKKQKAGYMEYLKHLGERWSWLKYILLRRSIDPWGKFFIFWEITRNIVIVVDVLVTLLAIGVLDDYQNINDIVVAVSRATAGIDIYIRFHCQYYNEEGILITHPLYTAKYYLKHALLIDFISALPMTILRVSYIFGINYAIHAKFLYRLLTRPIQLYRILHALTLFQHQMHWSKGSVIMKVKYTIVLVVILGICANLLLLWTCKLHKSGHKVINNCSGYNWMSFSPVKDQFHHTYVLFLQSMYFIIGIYGNSINGMYKAVTAMEMRIFIALTFGLNLLKIVLMAKFTSSTIGGNVNLSIYQSRMKQFLKFAKEVSMNNRLIKEVIAHNEYIWKETQGTSISAVGNKLNLYLRVKFLTFLYESTLRSTSLFVHLSQYALRRLTLQLEEVHFKKGAEIIRCNDIQRKLYIVYKGSVNVSVANMVISTLNVGGIFGCFSRTGELRQTITVRATVHTIVLAIDSKNFHQVMPRDEEHIKDVMKDIRLLKLEYLEPFVSTREYHIEKKRHTGLLVCYEWFIVNVNKYIDQESHLYWLWEYMLNVHFSVISSLVMLTEICSLRKVTDHIAFLLFLYGMDVIFLSKVFMGFTLQYIDVTTGMIQRQPKKVMTRYLRSWFWFDLLTCVPFEYFLRLTDITNRYSGFGLLNRVFRYYYIIHYYNICSYKLNISKHLRWTYLIYKSLFVTQVMVNIWIFCACFQHNCIYVDVNEQKQKTNTTLDSILVAYAYIINIFTSTGLNYVQPMTLTEMCVAAVLVLSVQYVIAALASGFATLIIIENSTLSDYKYSIERLNMYLKGQYLSEAIRNNVWAYLLQLWKIQRGEWMPMLIQEAPSYLRQDIMKSLYMSHLENHFLFAKTHTDFLRQLVVHMERCIYFPGNYIVAQGDMDSTMYFIHKGEVGAYDTNSYNKEIQLHTLCTNMSFGEAQGLHQTPYLLSYKALTTVEVLALRQSTWEYLLKWFPATSEEISKRSAEYGLITDIRAEDTTAF